MNNRIFNCILACCRMTHTAARHCCCTCLCVDAAWGGGGGFGSCCGSSVKSHRQLHCIAAMASAFSSMRVTAGLTKLTVELNNCWTATHGVPWAHGVKYTPAVSSSGQMHACSQFCNYFSSVGSCKSGIWFLGLLSISTSITNEAVNAALAWTLTLDK